MATIVGAAFTAGVVMTFVAAALSAVLATAFAAALAPDCVSHYVQRFDRRNRIVARDDQLASDGTFLHRFVADDNAQARAGMQYRRKWIVDQLPETALPFKRDARHIQAAFAHVADGQRTFGTAARFYSAETKRTAHRDFA
jgi:hypothetical protein